MGNIAEIMKDEVVKMTSAFTEPQELLLEISPSLQTSSWQESQMYATPSSRWRAYINQICLHGFLNWVKAEYVPEASIWYSSPGIPAFWEFVNGTAILLNQKRVVLIPSEAIDDSELEVPQEWVDIPSWAADYYLAVQVTPDGEWVRIWSYITHQKLKSLADYDQVDRTYCIDARHLIKDLNAFWITYQFCGTEEMKGAIAPLPELSSVEAENLVQRLGDSSVTFPRLAVPFTTWGVLLENEQWRQRLYQERLRYLQQTAPTQFSQVQVNLSRWLEQIYDASWQAIETFFEPNSSSLAFNFRTSSGLSAAAIKRAKLIDLGIEIEAQKVILLIALIPEANQQVSIRVQLHPASNQPYLPANIKLVLLSDRGEILQQVQARVQDIYVQLKLFDGEVGECFSIQIDLNNYQITENFII
ncbi:hypothetical protein NIES4072_02940 [Nostoc commune NIES-4072]|uniref:DUF1822 family protein n=1 Tax=Nostoc commune NIES-4072 TaxID=2005467 RepID=A0A2R5FH53_NOSCO|nr:DUF1822 family protein [Nostoc commune]BBD66027.1 hypothetical protein NIES4070_23880 [Nostoc commune HK-02]GBG16648.1 hypothetical protein NIES4072_02940 [Nostoc commune NIES-4072]